MTIITARMTATILLVTFMIFAASPFAAAKFIPPNLSPPPCSSDPSELVFIQVNGYTIGAYGLVVNPATGHFVLSAGPPCDYSQTPPLCGTTYSYTVCSGGGAMVIGGMVVIPYSKCQFQAFPPPPPGFSLISGAGLAGKTAKVTLVTVTKPPATSAFSFVWLPYCTTVPYCALHPDSPLCKQLW
jgi:hypothetical protein